MLKAIPKARPFRVFCDGAGIESVEQPADRSWWGVTRADFGSTAIPIRHVATAGSMLLAVLNKYSRSRGIDDFSRGIS